LRQGVLEGVIDVVDMRVIRWTDPSGKAMQVVDLTSEEHPGLYAKALQARETLLEQLADADEAIMRAVLEVHPRTRVLEGGEGRVRRASTRPSR
jgi:translation elongation factor EF-G